MFGFMDKARDHAGYIRALDLLIPFIAVACVSPSYLRNLVLISGAMIPRVYKALSALKHLEVASEACVTKRQELLADGEDDKHDDMLSRFFDVMREQGEKKDFGVTEVKMEVYGALYAP
jgi:hypothetical protein